MKHAELKSQIHRFAGAGTPLFIQGSPGVGKSWLVREVAKDMASRKGKKFLDWADLTLEEKVAFASGPEDAIERGLDKERAKEIADNGFFLYAVLNMVENDLTDIKGVLALAAAGKSTHYADWRPPMLMVAMARKGRHGLLFLDELTQTMPENLSPSFKLVLDHIAGDVKLSRDVKILAAGNSVSDHSASFEMPMALRNRFGHTKLDAPSNNDWVEWGMGEGLDMRVLSYIKAYPDALTEDVGAARSRSADAYPSARSFHRLANLIEGQTDPDVIGVDATAMVGSVRGLEFKAFVKNAAEIDYEGILEDPSKFGALKAHIRWGAVSGLAAMFKQNQKGVPPKLVRLCEVVDDDIAMLLLKAMIRIDRVRFIDTVRKAGASRIVEQYFKFLDCDLKGK